MTSRHLCSRFIVDCTIKDAPVCDAASRVAATRVCEMKVHAATDIFKMFVQTLVVLQMTPVLDLGLMRWMHNPSKSCRVSKIESSALVEKSMPEIMNKLGDTNLQIIPLYVLSPLQNVLNVRLAQGRCELLEKMIKKYPPSYHRTCIFCEEKNDKFSPEGLDDHYDKECPMLIRCSNCKQIVEIASLTEHLLEECESKSQYQQCPLCLEAIPSLNFDNHIKIRMCTMAKSSSEANHCPLCHKNIEPEEQGWRNHLMSDNGCAFNPRRKDKKNSKKRKFLWKSLY
ncbi:UNVERIFIED_CONTAM: Centrosomal protein [Trichonephila clavipes]